MIEMNTKQSSIIFYVYKFTYVRSKEQSYKIIKYTENSYLIYIIVS